MARTFITAITIAFNRWGRITLRDTLVEFVVPDVFVGADALFAVPDLAVVL